MQVKNLTSNYISFSINQKVIVFKPGINEINEDDFEMASKIDVFKNKVNKGQFQVIKEETRGRKKKIQEVEEEITKKVEIEPKTENAVVSTIEIKDTPAPKSKKKKNRNRKR